jgi:hypothetical protein
MIVVGQIYRRVGTQVWYGREVHAERLVTAIEANQNYPSGRCVQFKSRFIEWDKEGEWPGSGFADLDVFTSLCV